MIFIFNGRFCDSEQPQILVDNRSFRYGDGLFETMKARNGKLDIADLHFERLFTGLRLLQFSVPSFFSPAYIRDQVFALCRENELTRLARIRLTVFRGEGAPFEEPSPPFHFIIQAWPLSPDVEQINAAGWTVDVFPDARKSCDLFSSLKSNNYLPYLMGARYAKDRRLNDALVLNAFDRIAESTVANIFLYKRNAVYTPPLSEGCVAGVMRRFLLKMLRENGWEVQETPIHPQELAAAEEIWLSNAIQGLRWVASCGSSAYGCEAGKRVHTMLFSRLKQEAGEDGF